MRHNFYKQLFYFILLFIFVALTTWISLKDIRGISSQKNKGTEDTTTKTEDLSTPTPPTSNLPGPLTHIVKQLTGQQESLKIRELIMLTNKERVKIGLAPLVENTTLDRSSQVKATDLLARQYFEHESPTGETVGDLTQHAGYEYLVIGENLALGTFIDNQSVIDAWMASPGHKANILDARYVDIGMSAIKGTYKGDSVWVIVQHFGLPLDVCPPAADQKLKAEITAETIALTSVKKDLTAQQEQINVMNQSDQDYKDEITSYNANAEKYNNRLTALRELITEYNSQIKIFNSCVTVKGTAQSAH